MDMRHRPSSASNCASHPPDMVCLRCMIASRSPACDNHVRAHAATRRGTSSRSGLSPLGAREIPLVPSAIELGSPTWEAPSVLAPASEEKPRMYMRGSNVDHHELRSARLHPRD